MGPPGLQMRPLVRPLKTSTTRVAVVQESGFRAEAMTMPEHKWFSGGMTSEDCEEMTNFYKEKYGAVP